MWLWLFYIWRLGVEIYIGRYLLILWYSKCLRCCLLDFLDFGLRLNFWLFTSTYQIKVSQLILLSHRRCIFKLHWLIIRRDIYYSLWLLFRSWTSYSVFLSIFSNNFISFYRRYGRIGNLSVICGCFGYCLSNMCSSLRWYIWLIRLITQFRIFINVFIG